jgi:protein-S-isoprenylcysteine O-methyltransferase Ste14
MIPLLATVIRVLWLIAECVHSLTHRAESAALDRFSRTVWDVANCLSVVGIIIGFSGRGRVAAGSNLIALCGLALLVAGIAIRWTAIHTLGRYFTRTVTIKEDHRIIRSGLYKHLRHPSYTGALLAHAGLGLAFRNWLSFTLIFVPILVAALYRMSVEENALKEAFGREYVEYAQKTKRLIPKVY